MIAKLDRDQLEAELSALTSLLESLPVNDYLGRMGLESRRDEVNEKFDQLGRIEERRAKVALYFGGAPVAGSMAIQAGFGTKVVGSFQDLLSKVWDRADGDPAIQMFPVNGKSASQLHITNLVHGSFGFLLEEMTEDCEPMFESSLSQAVDQVATYLACFASESDEGFISALEDLNPRVFQSLREFFGHIHKGNATFRLVEGAQDYRFDQIAVTRAWQRVEASNVDEEQTQLHGKLLGVIPMRRRFEFEPDGSTQIIEGKVGAQFSHSYLERISTEQFAGRRWKALFQKRLVKKMGRSPVEKYTLLKLEEIGTE